MLFDPCFANVSKIKTTKQKKTKKIHGKFLTLDINGVFSDLSCVAELVLFVWISLRVFGWCKWMISKLFSVSAAETITAMSSLRNRESSRFHYLKEKLFAFPKHNKKSIQFDWNKMMMSWTFWKESLMTGARKTIFYHRLFGTINRAIKRPAATCGISFHLSFN